MNCPIKHLGTLLLAALLALQAGCSSPPVNHGDFKSARTMFNPKHIRSVWSPGFASSLEKPLEWKAVNLPAEVVPLGFSLGSVCASKEAWEAVRDRPWRGVLLVEALSYPGRKPLGKLIYDEAKGWKRARVVGSNKPLKSFILRVSVKEPFDPPMDFSIHYGAVLDGN